MHSQVLLLAALCASALAQTCTNYYTQDNCPATTLNPTAYANIPSCGSVVPGNDSLVFVLIGDYGMASANCETYVVNLVSSINAKFGPLDFIATMGDNNYWDGACSTADTNIGQFFAGQYFQPGPCVSPGDDHQPQPQQQHQRQFANGIRFFPSPGNHDYDKYHMYGPQLPYLQYFSYLPKIAPVQSLGLYYDIDPVKVIGRKRHLSDVVELFALNSNIATEPVQLLQQQKWLKSELAQSTAKWKVVYFHHAPFTTAQHDAPAFWMDWPFHQWGASIVVSGHEHSYERILRNETDYYIVNGMGGHPWIYDIDGPQCPPIAGSQVRYNKAHGAMLGIASRDHLQFCFYSVENNGTLVDQFAL